MTFCHYAECRDLFIVMLSVIMLSVIMLSVIMLSVIVLNVTIVTVVAPNFLRGEEAKETAVKSNFISSPIVSTFRIKISSSSTQNIDTTKNF
jgi:hypothetical protein